MRTNDKIINKFMGSISIPGYERSYRDWNGLMPVYVKAHRIMNGINDTKNSHGFTLLKTIQNAILANDISRANFGLSEWIEWYKRSHYSNENKSNN